MKYLIIDYVSRGFESIRVNIISLMAQVEFGKIISIERVE